MLLPHVALPSVLWILLSCLMLLSDVQGEDSQKKQHASYFSISSCPEGSNFYDSHCYALFLEPKTWNDADLDCQMLPSGHLVSLVSEAEGSFVASLVKTSSHNYSNIWIGLHDPSMGLEPNARGWQWSNTDVLNYLSWERDPATISNPGYCGTLSRNTGFLKWKDYNCDQKLPYVCMMKN
ncbi:PREDICTED: regenerating islet-derived protein 3-gamma-like [Chrysochloris asiatica]|uniref:Regenerating islet-derived protein 3-gamma-like n=1 Tax=Chrysochloris asiatica TaxID=185453 RepID=A0A9B0U6Z2_CHRAS|nr:PREDICTED: regenerating islet-derived protein 3-gamma-like [Chrysochloris asiatica]